MAQSPADFAKNFTVIENLRIPMRDGIHLSGFVVRHKSDTLPMPAILVSSCYPAEGNKFRAAQVLRKGFAGIMVYSRGKEKSEGVFEPFEHEAQDNYDVIEWLTKQPWCNGKVGMFGGSYLGFTQWAACKNLHPALKTIVPQVAAAPGIDFPMQNGVPMPYMLRWLNYTTNQRMVDTASFNNLGFWYRLYNRLYTQGIAFNQLDSLDKSPDKIFQRWLQHPDYDNYWAGMIPSTPEEYAKINIPILTITGYFDADQLGAMHYYQMHNRYGPTEAVKNHYLLIGPWDHGGAQFMPGKKIGSYTVDSAAIVPIINIVMDWFDYTLKGKAKPALLKDRVNRFVMGGGWKHVASLQAMNTDTLRFYLKNDSADSFLSLSASVARRSKPIALYYDPTDVQDSVKVFKKTEEFESDFANEYLTRHNQLVFQTPPLKEEIELNGSPIAALFVSVNKRDVDFSLAFYEVLPDGKSFPLSSSVHRASYHRNRSKRESLKAGKVTSFRFEDTFFTSRRIRKGSRIRFVLKPLNSPFWQKNYGSGEDVSREVKIGASPLVIKVFTDEKHASCVLLPCYSG
ncbi:MAG: CocE/NonD family hydrolase [Cytophagales bacterium]|nr:CocE/NonD family hydrolase [Cytophagales bacterium]